VATFDLNILPIHRINGQESADLPGLLAVTPPRKTARGREKDNLIVYLMLSGNAIFSAAELTQLNNTAAGVFYQSPGSLTSAMRKSAETINTTLLQRNLSTSGRGQYALGFLVLASVREGQCTLLLCGPTHAVWVGEGGARHIHDAALSGKGLGSSQSYQTYFSQVELHPNDLLVLCGKFPKDWEADLLSERPPASMDAGYRKLTFTKGDLNAALIQAKSGHGTLTILRPEINSRPSSAPSAPTQNKSVSVTQESVVTESFDSQDDVFPQENVDFKEAHPRSEPPIITEEELDELADLGAHMVQPSAYAIPPQPEEMTPSLLKEETPSTPLSATASSPSTPRSFPPSIPRAKQAEPKIEPVIQPEPEVEEEEEDTEAEEPVSVQAHQTKAEKSDAHAEATRQMAKVMVSGIQTGRRVNERLGTFLQRFIPRLLPGAEDESQQQRIFIVPTYAMVFIAVVIPVIVVVIASVVYLRYGQSVQYDEFYSQAIAARAQAVSETDPARQRQDWQNVLDILDKADTYRETDESKVLRAEAQNNYDNLMGVVRLEFVPAFTNGLGGSTQISRMAANESDLYMLNAEGGNILHASFTGQTLELDGAFNCQPGMYAGYEVGTLVDLLALPKVNSVGASVLGIDATGNLLYCSPGQVPQAFSLPALPNTNWGRITSFVLDNGNLYVLDATSRSVWVFVGKDGLFNDTPYFYFGNQIPNTIDTAIDLSVSGDDLYLLHADGHMSTCIFSRINETPTRCTDPATIQDPFPAHKDVNVFADAHFTQMSLTSPPTPVILLLDSENQSVFRFSPRTLELLNQIGGHAGRGNPFKSGQVGAMTVSPNYVLYLAIGNQVYFATNLP
jgi:hypothetical protein